MRTLLNYLLNRRWALRVVMPLLGEAKREKIYIARFRAELSCWGYDVSDLTDEEIKDGISKMGEMVSMCGMTAGEINRAFRVLATVFSPEKTDTKLTQ